MRLSCACPATVLPVGARPGAGALGQEGYPSSAAVRCQTATWERTSIEGARECPGPGRLLGIGFSQAVARQVPLTAIMIISPPLMYAGGSHVSPRGIIKLGCDGVNAYATPESAPNTGAGFVELRDCHDPVVWKPHCGDV